MNSISKRFINYVKFDTQSDPKSDTCPSTEKQKDLGNFLLKELHELGLENAYMDKNGYVYAHLEKNCEEDIPAIGFIAHMDTAPDFSGTNVNPQVFTYKGGDIELKSKRIIKRDDFPFLDDLVGQEIITSDGNTLLGADDKAGIAIILEALSEIVKDQEFKHGKICIAFTPDEEIGRGADLFDVDGFGADFAYTFDGGPLGELEFENFNGAAVRVEIDGVNIHPGSAKDIMVNSLLIASEFIENLPKDQRPSTTEGYEGFYHVLEVCGTVEKTCIELIIRDHDRKKFEDKKQFIKDLTDKLNEKYKNLIKTSIKDSYYNMREIIEKNIHIVELAKKSMQDIGIRPLVTAIRGGTDGASLSFKGLPCPNLFTGGYNYHGPYELIPTESMQKGKELMIKILENARKVN